MTDLDTEYPLSAEQIASYRKNGWLLIEGLLDRATTEAIRLAAQRTADAGVQPAQSYYNDQGFQRVHSIIDEPLLSDPTLNTLPTTRRFGSLARSLIGRDTRFYRDCTFAKPPQREQGVATGWHQDLCYWPFDRKGALTIWIALVDVPAIAGSMRFINGSHQWGPLGRAEYSPDKHVLQQYPEIQFTEADVSPPLDLKAGSATVHDGLTMHSAPPNSADFVRWAYALSYMPADTWYTGTPTKICDPLGLKVSAPFDHPKFPRV